MIINEPHDRHFTHDSLTDGDGSHHTHGTVTVSPEPPRKPARLTISNVRLWASGVTSAALPRRTTAAA